MSVPQRNEDEQVDQGEVDAAALEVRCRDLEQRLLRSQQLLAQRDDAIGGLHVELDCLQANLRQMGVTLSEKDDYIRQLEGQVAELTDQMSVLDLPVVTGPAAT